jgi:trk system potassium uptake protein TrkH
VAFVIGTIGACSGSSAAGLSVFRVQVALSALRAHLAQITSPNTVAVVKYDGRRVEEDVQNGLILFFTGYILLLGLMTVAVSLTGVDTVSAFFAIWTTLGNVGYGFGPLVLRTGTFIDFPQGAIAIMTVAMLLGRLGLLAILVVLLPAFWRR